MRVISRQKIIDTVSRLCVEANMILRPDVSRALRRALEAEKKPSARRILVQLLENAQIARRENLALCQDTGLPVVFCEIGRDLDLSAADLDLAIQRGVEDGYKRGYLRKSIVHDPLERSGLGYSPCVIHFSFHRRQGLKLTVFPKGFGSENRTQLKMFSPTVSHEKIEDFVVSCVEETGPDACPPYILGVGIGGTSDYAGWLAKKALLRPVGKSHTDARVAAMEKRILAAANKLNIGPMGVGGKTTVLGVSMETYPTHIAGLPVAVNISCHVLRSASASLR